MTSAVIFAITVAFYASGCIRQRIGNDVMSVPPGCAACHDAISELTGEDHPPVTKGDIQYCRTCHVTNGDAAPLSLEIHLSHLSSPDLSGDCWSCHFLDQASDFRLIGDEKKTETTKNKIEKLSPYFHTWADSGYLDHTHAKAGTDCSGCHETPFPDNGLSMEECLKCHGSYEELAEATRETEPNPHDSHYMDLRCTLCHKVHTDSVLYCNTCHEFELDVP
jgi:hypothetical protein